MTAINPRKKKFTVALIFGMSGACRSQELTTITVDDIKYEGKLCVVDIPTTKNYKPRQFVIDRKFFDLIDQYRVLRPDKPSTNRFFIKYSKGKCQNQPMGINKFMSMPKTIASFLGLADSHLYTGHSFRRTSATLLVDSGADLTTLKRDGGWASSTVAEGLIDNSMRNKCEIANRIIERIDIPQTSTSHQLQHSVDINIPSTSRNEKEEHVQPLHKQMKMGQKEKAENETLSPRRQSNIIIQNCHFYFHNNDKKQFYHEP